MNEDDAGVFDAIDPAGSQAPEPQTQTPAPVEQPAQEQTQTAETPQEPQQPSQDESEGEGVIQDYFDPNWSPEEQTPTEEPETSEEAPSQEAPKTEEAEEPAKTEEGENTNTETEQQTPDEADRWREELPPPPSGYQGPRPEYNERGEITNMGPAEYEQYQRESLKADMRQEQYESFVENKALENAEKVLPELKTNPAVQQLVQDARVAAAINGEQIDSFEAAKKVKEALGIAPDKLSEAKKEGAASAKASITVQKNAALETGSGQQAPTFTPEQKLQERLASGDDHAFEELMDIWEEKGIV